jgi:L-amino acid N-acyltransferase YncA
LPNKSINPTGTSACKKLTPHWPAGYFRRYESKKFMIRKANQADSKTIAAIYNHYVKNTIITFEEKEVTSNEISKRIENVFSESLPWIVAENNGKVIGYAYATKWRVRSAYRFSVESTVYLEHTSVGNGFGGILYKELLSLLEASRIHVVIGGIALPNPSSIALHEKFGFKQVAHFKEVGTKFDKWIDVGYWQLQFNS